MFLGETTERAKSNMVLLGFIYKYR